jgi:hypothetical protein
VKRTGKWTCRPERVVSGVGSEIGVRVVSPMVGLGKHIVGRLDPVD